jgi:SynChlorMet cassette radical SAM/SPASM protein ScmE
MAALTDLPTERWLSVFEELGRLAVLDVVLSGGEPFVRPDLFHLVDGIIANRMRYSILSNGTLIDDDVLAQFDVGKRRLRLNYVQVSVDGSRAEIHNRSRPHSFEAAMRGLRLLKRAGLPVEVRVTINRHNYRDLENIAGLLLEEIGLPSFGTNAAAPLGSGCCNELEIVLSPLERVEAMEAIDRLMERYPGRLKAQAGPQADRRMYDAMEHARQTGQRSMAWDMGYLSACGCVFSQIDVLHDGSIVPCNMLPTLVLGNITRDSLGEVWRTHPTLEAIRGRRGIPMEEVLGCGDCEWSLYCNGGCPAPAYQQSGDLNQASREFCYRHFLQEVESIAVG